MAIVVVSSEPSPAPPKHRPVGISPSSTDLLQVTSARLRGHLRAPGAQGPHCPPGNHGDHEGRGKGC